MSSKYVDICLTYEILLQDSGLLPKPKTNWNTFVPKVNDLALVEDKEYIFNGTTWVETDEVIEVEDNRGNE